MAVCYHNLPAKPNRAKASSTKLQAPEKLQIPSSQNTNSAVYLLFGVWCLVLLWSLLLGAWSFGGLPGERSSSICFNPF
jgi:hypothetical protein